MLEADQRYNNQPVHAAVLREERDALVEQLRTHIRDVRFLLDRSVGTAVSKSSWRISAAGSTAPSSSSTS